MSSNYMDFLNKENFPAMATAISQAYEETARPPRPLAHAPTVASLGVGCRCAPPLRSHCPPSHPKPRALALRGSTTETHARWPNRRKP